MRISFSQPVFIPWGGFYGRLLNSDLMVILDNTQFARGFTFVNRNRLKGPRGEIWVTVPVRKKGLGKQKVRELRICRPEIWTRKFLALLKHYYGHSLYLAQTMAALESIFSSSGDHFLRLAQDSARFLADCFGIKTAFKLQSELGAETTGVGLLVELARQVGAEQVLLPHLADRHLDLKALTGAGLKVFFLKYSSLPYPQFWGPFAANLSALDLWLCCGPEGYKKIVQSSRLTCF